MSFFDTTWYVKDNSVTTPGDGTIGWSAVAKWAALTAYTAGQFVRQNAAPAVGAERCFVCIIAGTSLAAEPTWTVTRGAKTAEAAGPTWQECTGMPGTCGDTANSVVWAQSTAYSLGELIYVSSNGSLQICSTAGTSKAAPIPAFSATAGTTTADNTATWTSLGVASGYSTLFLNPHARLGNAFASTWGASSNTFFVQNTHAETNTSNTTLTSPGNNNAPCIIYSVSDTAAPATTLAQGGAIAVTGSNTFLAIRGYAYYYGVSFNSGNSTNASTTYLDDTGQAALYFESCTFKLLGNNINSIISFGSTQTTRLIVTTNCTFVFSNASQKISYVSSGYFYIINATIAATGTVPTTIFAGGGLGGGFWIVRDTDISNITGNLISVNTGDSLQFYLENCKLANAVSVTLSNFSDAGSIYVHMHNCDSTSTNYRYFYANYLVTYQQETTIVRTGSLATDGTVTISWKAVTTANSSYLQPSVSEEIAQWNDLVGNPLTATIYLTSNTALTNGDAWIEIEYPSQSAVPLGASSTTRAVPLAATTALTTDTSVWGGAITNKYKIATAFTPQMKGPIKARLYVGKASTTVYFDPYIYLA
jgi:hypothetical protein